MDSVEKVIADGMQLCRGYDQIGAGHAAQPVRDLMNRLAAIVAAQGEAVVCAETHPNSRYLFKVMCARFGIKLGVDTVAEALDKIPNMNNHPAPAASVPKGWKLVPVEPTAEMIEAAFTAYSTRMIGPMLKAGISASPTPQHGRKEGDVS